MVRGDTERRTVPRDALTPLERSPHLPRTPAQPYESNSNNGARVPVPPAHVPDISSEFTIDRVLAGKKDLFYSRHWSRFLSPNFYPGPTQDSKLTIKALSEIPLRPNISPPLLCQIEKSTLIHSFLIMPKCPMTLLERNLLSKFTSLLP